MCFKLGTEMEDGSFLRMKYDP